MKIALLIPELKNDRYRRFCQGAALAAKEKEVTLVICPGKYLPHVDHKSGAEKSCFFQETAIFDYISAENTDVLLVDIRGLGKYTTQIKKERFLKRFAKIPTLVLADTEGYLTAGGAAAGHHEAAGYQAVLDAISFLENRTCAPKITSETELSTESVTAPAALECVARAAARLTHMEIPEGDNAYEAVLDALTEYRVENGGIFLFHEAQRNEEVRPWKVPERVLSLAMMRAGAHIIRKEAEEYPTEHILSAVTGEDGAGKTFLFTALFIDNRQIGALICDFTPALGAIHVSALTTNLVIDAIRLIVTEQQLIRTEKALSENREALERDGTVLERFSDRDPLSGCFNRNGFFAKAYDMLKADFTEGSYAVVSYVDMDSIKVINDYFGREEGDKVVKRVAEILEQVFGKDALLGRIRGDEYAVLLITDDEELSHSLRMELSQQNTRLMSDEEQPYTIHLQYAVCQFQRDDNLSLKEMLAETDEHLKRMHR